MATAAEQVGHLVDRAVRIARDQRTVTCILFPNDVQILDAVEVPPHEHGTVHSGIGTTSSVTVPSQADLAQAANVLNAGKKR